MSRWGLYDHICTSLEDCEFRLSGYCQAGLGGKGIEQEDCYARIVVNQDNSKLYRALFRNQRRMFETISKQKER